MLHWWDFPVEICVLVCGTNVQCGTHQADDFCEIANKLGPMSTLSLSASLHYTRIHNIQPTIVIYTRDCFPSRGKSERATCDVRSWFLKRKHLLAVATQPPTDILSRWNASSRHVLVGRSLFPFIYMREWKLWWIKRACNVMMRC